MSGKPINSNDDRQPSLSGEHEESPEKARHELSPWSWVPSLYFAEGLPYVAVTLLSIEIYMQMGLSDAQIPFYDS